MFRIFYVIFITFFLVLVFIVSLPELIFKLVWKIITYPFRGLKSLKQHLKIAKFIATHRREKVLIYNYSNYKVVETYLFPLLDKSVITYFIDKDGSVSPTNDCVSDFIQYCNLKGGYPYLLKVGQKTYWYKSLKKMVTGLKNGQINPVYAQSQIHFFFESEEE